jgi:hypothetical protein
LQVGGDAYTRKLAALQGRPALIEVEEVPVIDLFYSALVQESSDYMRHQEHGLQMDSVSSLTSRAASSASYKIFINSLSKNLKCIVVEHTEPLEFPPHCPDL